MNETAGNRSRPPHPSAKKQETYRTMRGLITTLASLMLAMTAVPALAQSATKMGQHGLWGTYSYQSKSGKVCYVLTMPKQSQPATLDHGAMYFFVSQRPGQAVAYEPQFIAGYQLKPGSKVSVTIGDKTFTMFPRGNSAWLENAAEEPLLIAAMKSGADMKVAAESGRGNETSYAFSLNGISAALSSIADCK
jgi:invasion protein IalB